MTKIRTPSPLTEASSRLHPSILPAGNPIQRAVQGAQQQQRKPRRPLSEEEVRLRAEEREEMQSLLSKLKQLVPGIPKRRKLSKLEIIQHVIDYIFDLQVALESHPINSNANQAAVTSAAMEFLNFQISQQQHQLNPESYQQQQQTDSSSTTSSSTPCDLAYQMIYQSQHEPIRINQAPPRTERQPLASIML